MAHEVTLPRQGWSMEEAVFVDWLKRDGERVQAGEPIFTVETEKAVQEIESLDAGILRLLPDAPGQGDTVRVGEVFGYLVAEGEAVPAVGGALRPEPDDLSSPASSAETSTETSPLAPACKSAAACIQAAPEQAVPAGRPVSPRAARRAIREGVDLRRLRGTGKGGRIRDADVLAALRQNPASTDAPATPHAPFLSPMPGREEPVTTLRRTIAEHMHRSKTLSAPVTLTTRTDAVALVQARERMKADANGGPVPSYGDIIMEQVARTLKEHPALNARWENDRIKYPDAIHIGFAVDTVAGLVVPVVRDAPKHALSELASITRDLAQRAKARRLSAGEMSGGTFTVSNLGMEGIDVFTPIANWPECAVLGIGRITREPVADGERVVIRDQMWLSLTFDHRIVDGAPAARFLNALRARIESLK